MFIKIQQFVDSFEYKVLLKAEFILALNLEFSLDTTRDIIYQGIRTIDNIDYAVYSCRGISEVTFIINRIIDDLDDTIKDFKAQHPDYP